LVQADIRTLTNSDKAVRVSPKNRPDSVDGSDVNLKAMMLTQNIKSIQQEGKNNVITTIKASYTDLNQAHYNSSSVISKKTELKPKGIYEHKPKNINERYKYQPFVTNEISASINVQKLVRSTFDMQKKMVEA